ncbi:MAG: hypothetical protein IH597_01295 [Bacteroidales bacterium]|nr:hypothetical protein [Bacteroidales bacterium]
MTGRFVVAVFLCSFFVPLSGNTSPHYDFNANCIKAYTEIISLNFMAGAELLSLEKTENPANRIPVFLENYIDFLTLAIGEEQSDFEQLKQNRSVRINILSSGEPNSAWHKHCQAAVYLQWSFARVKFGEYTMAGLDLNRAYRLLEENKTLYPGFVPDMLLNGVMNALIGSIPDNYKWASRLAGMEGAIESGRTMLYQLLDITDATPQWAHLKSETFFYLAFIEMNLQSDKNRVVELLKRMESTDGHATGPLNCYIKANLAMRTRNNDKAIEILEGCKIPDGSYPFHYLEFVIGNAKLNRLDQSAAKHFLNYVNHYKGSNYIKSAYQRLAWLSLLKGDYNGYRFYISLILKHGQTFVDEDKQAQAEALSDILPQTSLLKARLLFDGGYFEDALEALGTNVFSEPGDSVEYLYRKARIYHEWGKPVQAKDFYLRTIEAGSDLKYYFAGNSALQMGLISESEGKYTEAAHYYDMSIKMHFTEYRNSIQQKAKAGLQRVRK